MSWSRFNTNVEFTVGSNTYLIPIWNLKLSSGPYAREIAEATALRAFDGRHYQMHQGWRTRVTFHWPEMTAASQQILYDFMVDLASTGVCSVNFNPSSTAQTINMIIEDPSATLQAAFKNRARLRPASLTLVSQNITSNAPPWITDDIEQDTIMWVSDSGKFYVTSADFAVTIEPNPSLDLSFLVPNARQLELDQNTGKLWTILNGTVYNWNCDGTGFQTAFSTPYADEQGLVLDWQRQRMAITAHEVNFANHRWRLVGYAGNEISDHEFRSGLSTLQNTIGQYYSRENWFMYANTAAILYVEPAPSFDIDGLGCIAHVACQDLCIDEPNNVAYHLCSPGLFYQAANVQQTGSCSDNDTFLSNVPNNSTQVDVFHANNQVWLVGGGTTSFKVQNNGQGYGEDWVPSGESIHLLCTRRAMYQP